MLNSLPNVSLSDQASPIASPVTSCPTRALVQEFVAVLQSRLNLTLSLVLNPGLPLMADQPTGNKVVVVGIQDPLSPFLVLESLEKVVASKNIRAIGSSAS